MDSNAEQLLGEAMKLSAPLREELADRLYLSLHLADGDEAAAAALDASWAEEVARRVEDIHTGRITTKPAEEVHAKARDRAGR